MVALPIRDRYPKVAEKFRSEWPRCLLDCGLVPEAVAWEAPMDNHSQMEIIDLTSEVSSEDGTQQQWAQECRTGRYGELSIDGYIVVFTDGAARRNQCKHLRFAGFGAFWGDNHPFNGSAPLDGKHQTNNRAELQAVAYVLGVEVRPVDIRTDSAYVQKGISKYLSRWKASGWVRGGRPIQNSDLWQTIASSLENRPAESVKVTKVKGHASVRDVHLGLVCAIDKHGNDSADGLAVAGALRKRQTNAEGERKHNTVLVTISMHKMMLEICQARAEEARRRQATQESEETSSSSASEGSVKSSTSASSSSTATIAAGRRRARGRAAPAAAE